MIQILKIFIMLPPQIRHLLIHAMIKGKELIEEKTGITTMTAEDAMTAVAIGTGKYVEFLSGKAN